VTENHEKEAEPGQNRARLRSFGRRRGRKLSDRQSELLTNGLEACKIDLGKPIAADELPRIFAEPVAEVWLEIGFGAGEHLVWQAEHNAHAGIIGAEPYVNGVVAAISALQERKLGGRVAIHPDDVIALLNWLPPGSLSRAFMLFPDPWPKKRHRERRLFAPPLLDKLAALLRAGAELRFASDIADYAEAAIEHAKAHPDFDLAQVFTTTNRDTMPDWPVTRYERKALKQGRPATFIVLRRRG
jgi:tRNA (guanine-N7-)-methyltransferase